MKDIVVGVNDSAASAHALDRALLESQLCGASVRAVTAWTTPVWMGGVPGFAYNVLASPEDSERAAHDVVDEALMKASARRGTNDATVSARAEAQEGDAGRVLVRLARDADLVVLGTGRKSVRAAVLGSTTSYVLHHATSPVMVVPADAPTAEPFQRVVVGVDGSANSRAALRWGRRAARRHDCPMVAVHAWRYHGLGSPATSRGYGEHEAEARAWLERELVATLPEEPSGHVRAQLLMSSPTAALLDIAGPEDLLVVGSRGSGGFATLLLGSVALQCAQHARGALAVVRPEQDDLDR